MVTGSISTQSTVHSNGCMTSTITIFFFESCEIVSDSYKEQVYIDLHTIHTCNYFEHV